jgi:hypothetical protein
MSCDNTRFVISKGSDNTFTFTIKQDNSTLPLIIEVSDTFKATLVNLEDGTSYPQLLDKELTVESIINGKVELTLPKEDTVNLVVSKGSKVDRYYLRPVYKLVIDCVTTNNGNFIAKVPEVYVD